MLITNEDWLQAQYSVLGAALLDEKTAIRVVTETAEEDYSGPAKTVYKTIRSLFVKGKPLDPVSVGSMLGSEYRGLLVQLMDMSPTAANVGHHIRICKEQAQVLAIRSIADQMLQAETADEMRKLLETANSRMVARQSRKAMNMSEALKSFMERHTRQVRYLSWPIREFNEHLYSEPGDFIIFGAEPSVGKTAFALQCAWHWAKDLLVGFFSFETSSEKLFDRKMASLAGLQMQSIKNNSITQAEWDRVCQATEEITSRSLELVPAAGMTVADIRAKIIESGYQLIVVDYLQLISASGHNRYEKVTNISIELHNMAQSLGVTVVALSQLSRSNDDGNPKNSDLRESGQLEQDADILLMLKLEKQTEPSGPRKAIVTKNKEGELFMMLMDFDGRHQTFSKSQTSANKAMFAKRPPKPTPVLKPESGQMSMLPMSTDVPFTD